MHQLLESVCCRSFSFHNIHRSPKAWCNGASRGSHRHQDLQLVSDTVICIFIRQKIYVAVLKLLSAVNSAKAQFVLLFIGTESRFQDEV